MEKQKNFKEKVKFMARGKQYEWEICKLLSECWDESGRDDIFCPCDSSGARATRRRLKGKDTAFRTGDITFSDPVGKPLIDIWNMELKTGYGKKKKHKARVKTSLDGKEKEVLNKIVETPWDLLELIDSQQTITKFEEFWNQCFLESQESNREPVLIFRRNKRLSCIAFRKQYWNTLTNYCGSFEERTIVVNINASLQLVVVNLHDFLNWTGDLQPLVENCLCNGD